MQSELIEIANHICHIIKYGETSEAVIVKPLCEFERLLLADECNMIANASGKSFTMIAFEVEQDNLRPEKSDATVQFLIEELLPYIEENIRPRHLILGGYSLGGLFAMTASTKTNAFDAVFAGSPSLWIDGWNEYIEEHPVRARYIFMSLGDKEECTRKQPYCIIGDRVRMQHERNVKLLGEDNCALKWNEGGHFKDIEKRKAEGFAWCLNKIYSSKS